MRDKYIRCRCHVLSASIVYGSQCLIKGSLFEKAAKECIQKEMPVLNQTTIFKLRIIWKKIWEE